MLNNEIFPPEADMTYESFLERAKQGTASSGFVSLISFVINIPLDGCHNCGTTLVEAYKKCRYVNCKLKAQNARKYTISIIFIATFIAEFLSVLCHFQSL